MLQTLELNANALIDIETFYHMFKILVDGSLDEEDPDKKITITWAINSVSKAFESFCNRPLKAQDYTYDQTKAWYSQSMSIFDPPRYSTFFFPTYPINSVTIFTVRDIIIPLSTNGLATDGYILYNKTGKLIYEQGFDYGYFQTIKTSWNGGYNIESDEMAELQALCFKMVKAILTAQSNPMLQSETIGGYQYQMFSPTVISNMKGMSPDVFQSLGRYKREAIG